MDIDMSALRLLEREREIPLDLLIPTIEQALLVAYHKSPGAFEKARAELDRKSGHVTIWAVEIDDDGAPIGEFEHTRKGLAGSPPAPHARSSCSACAMLRTTTSWANSRAARASWCPAPSSRATTRT